MSDNLLVKICGITQPDQAELVSSLGADFMGFIFVQKSKRYISPERALELSLKSGSTKTVGVFANQSLIEVNHAVNIARLDYVQLHGDESPAYCKKVSRPVIKAFRVKNEESCEEIYTRIKPYISVTEFILLDSWDEKSLGGTGKTLDWNKFSKLSDLAPILLAGGLNPGNVKEAILEADPAGIDLSSGVEVSPGIKNESKLRQLFDQVGKNSL